MWDVLAELLIGAAVGLAAVAVVLKWDEIAGFFESHRTADAAYAVLIREQLQSGQYSVIAGVLDRDEDVLASRHWEKVKLTDELDTAFEGENILVMTY